MSLLKVNGLSKFFGTLRAVNEVGFTVGAGEIFVAGAPFSTSPQQAKRIMGVVPQELAIYEDLSGREN